MTLRRLTFFIAFAAVACLTLAGIQAQGGAAPTAGAPAQGGGGGRRGGGGGGAAQGAPAAPGAPAAAQGGGGGGRGGPQGKGTLTPVALDARGEGWMVKSYLDPKHLPLYNQAKQKLLDQKQVTSFTIGRLDPELYCESRKHYDFIWFEMQHSTMTWADMEKMIAACPGFANGMTGAPIIRMPNSLESDMQKGGDIGALGFIVPTIGDGALDASYVGNIKFAHYPPMGRRSSGAGQASRIWGGAGPARTPGSPLIASAPAINYAESINDNMLTVVMIETVESVIAANEIANTFGLDVIIEGNNDLSKFSGFSQNDDRYEDLKIRVHDAAIRAGKFYGAAGSQYLTGNILSPDTRLVQDGPAWDGYTPPARGVQQPAEPTVGMPGDGTMPGGAAPAAPGGGRGGRRGGGAGAPAPATPAPAK
jgi:2-keto-3-deoxy-L-rhamnonate aldolase RhmA